MALLDLFKFGQRKRIRALRMEQKLKRKAVPKFSNPYFPKKEIIEPIQDFTWKNFFLKHHGFDYLGIFVLLLGSFCYLIFGTNYLVLKNIDIQGNNNITQEEIKNNLNNYLSQKKIYFIPVNNWLFFNPDKAGDTIKEGIANKFALASIHVAKKWPNAINITIEERIPGLVWVSQDQYYYLDIDGVATQKIENKEGIASDFPIIYDKNNANIELNKQVISKELINYILSLQEKLPKIGPKIKSYSVPQITCQEQQYKMEKIINEEIEKTANKEMKEKKKKILERYNKGEITAEKSLELLEEIKNTENKTNDNTNTDNFETVKWETIFVLKECDFVKINKEINVKTEDGYEIYFDSTLNLDQQLISLKAILVQKIDNLKNLNYIDLRYGDRIYYK